LFCFVCSLFFIFFCFNLVREAKVGDVVLVVRVRAKVIDGVRVDEVRRQRRRSGETACLAGGSDTAVRFALENVLRPLFNKLKGTRAAGRVIRWCELGEEACSFEMSVPVAPVADLFRRRCFRRRRRL